MLEFVIISICPAKKVKVQLSTMMMIVIKIKGNLFCLGEGFLKILVLWLKNLSLRDKLLTNLINNRSQLSILSRLRNMMKRKRSRDKMMVRKSRMGLRKKSKREGMMDCRNLTSLFWVFHKWRKVIILVFRA